MLLVSLLQWCCPSNRYLFINKPSAVADNGMLCYHNMVMLIWQGIRLE